MEWEKIKKILAKEGGHCIILEEGEPSYLVKKLNESDEDIDEINRHIEEWQETGKEDDKGGEAKEVRVEDLPF